MDTQPTPLPQVPPVQSPQPPVAPQVPVQTAPSPKTFSVPEPEHTTSRTKLLLWILLVILLVAGVYAWMVGVQEPEITNVETPVLEDVIIEKAQMISADTYAVPSGFPTMIPLEAEVIFDSYKTTYNQESVEQYTVSYKSVTDREVKWQEYEDFLTNNGYRLVPDSTDEVTGSLYGLKENTGLLINIEETEDGSVVKLNYFVKR